MSHARELKDVSASHGHGAILHDINFDVPAGGVTALLGANGAGKTTTLRAICGMIETHGDVRLFGEGTRQCEASDDKEERGQPMEAVAGGFDHGGGVGSDRLRKPNWWLRFDHSI